VLAERASDWFELPDPMPEVATYMLGAFRARKEKAHLIPAVVHFDGTSRIQTVHRDTNPRFHGLLSEMERLTGVPVLLNRPPCSTAHSGNSSAEATAYAVNSF
jgi:carbamoyltransferase